MRARAPYDRRCGRHPSTTCRPVIRRCNVAIAAERRERRHGPTGHNLGTISAIGPPRRAYGAHRGTVFPSKGSIPGCAIKRHLGLGGPVIAALSGGRDLRLILSEPTGEPVSPTSLQRDCLSCSASSAVRGVDDRPFGRDLVRVLAASLVAIAVLCGGGVAAPGSVTAWGPEVAEEVGVVEESTRTRPSRARSSASRTGDHGRRRRTRRGVRRRASKWRPLLVVATRCAPRRGPPLVTD